MFFRVSYLVLTSASLALLGLGAPRGVLLTSQPELGPVERAEATGPHARGVGPAFVFLGFHGGK